jgi:hypothetical protein
MPGSTRPCADDPALAATVEYGAPDRHIAFDGELEERFGRIPEVESVALVSHAPVYGGFRCQLSTEREAVVSRPSASAPTTPTKTPAPIAPAA